MPLVRKCFVCEEVELRGHWGKRLKGDKEDNLPVPRIGLMCRAASFSSGSVPIVFGRTRVEKAGQLFGWNTKQWLEPNDKLLIEDQPVGGGVLPVDKEQAVEEEEGQDGATSSPAEQHARHPHPLSLHHHLNLRRFHHRCKIGQHRFRAIAFTFAQRCPSESWAKTDAGGKSARARTSCATPPPRLLLRSTTTTTEVSPSWWSLGSLSRGKWTLSELLFFGFPIIDVSLGVAGLLQHGSIANCSDQNAPHKMRCNKLICFLKNTDLCITKKLKSDTFVTHFVWGIPSPIYLFACAHKWDF
jgi:hypothetical protein